MGTVMILSRWDSGEQLSLGRPETGCITGPVPLCVGIRGRTSPSGDALGAGAGAICWVPPYLPLESFCGALGPEAAFPH